MSLEVGVERVSFSLSWISPCLTPSSPLGRLSTRCLNMRSEESAISNQGITKLDSESGSGGDFVLSRPDWPM